MGYLKEPVEVGEHVGARTTSEALSTDSGDGERGCGVGGEESRKEAAMLGSANVVEGRVNDLSLLVGMLCLEDVEVNGVVRQIEVTEKGITNGKRIKRELHSEHEGGEAARIELQARNERVQTVASHSAECHV